MVSSAIAPLSISSVASAMSSCRQSRRRAEQRWPGAEEGRGDDVADHLFGQGGGIDQHGVDAAGLGDERDEGARLVFEQGAGDAPGGGRRAR